MINKESILSAFTDRATLLLWLKKVEAALKNAVLSDVSVNQISDTEIRLEFKFEDGTSTLSPVLTLPRGPQGVAGPAGATGPQGPAGPEGPQGDPGRDGLDGEGIAATIEVGTVTTGAAGTDASVTNAGTEQRAILNFVIPRGNDGAPGPAGADGVGFGDATGATILSSPVLSSEQNGVKLTGNIIIEAGEETFEIPSSMVLPLTGSESIVVDIAEDGRSINIHLDATVLAKLNRTLVTPMSAPASISLVAVNTANAQEMLTLGNGLSVSGGVLSASGGGGGTKLYRHSITITKSGTSTYFEGISPHADEIDFDTLAMGSPDFLVFQVEKCATSWTPNLTSGGEMGIEGYYFTSTGTAKEFSFYDTNSTISDTVSEI